MRKYCYTLLIVCLGVAGLTYLFELEPFYYWFGLFALVLLIFLIMAEVVVWRKRRKAAKEEPDNQYGNYIYWDYESEPGCWPHNDSLSALMIYRTDEVVLSEEHNTDDGWTIVSKVVSEREGACGEQEETTEVRKNGMTIKYMFCWKKEYTWLLQHDIVRMLYDVNYYNEILAKAEKGEADAQTLIGCCYGHNGKMGNSFVNHDIKTAVEWWNKAAKQGHKYAMRELALYYWHKNEHEKAKKLNILGGLKIFIISYGDFRNEEMLKQRWNSLRVFSTVQWPDRLGTTHGVEHWDRVARFGLLIAEEDVDIDVVMAFAYLHDVMRRDDAYDIEHGLRATKLIDVIRSSLLNNLNDEQIAILKKACELHTTEHRTGNKTIDTCFDADRMDLLRVGITPTPERMATKRGAELVSDSDFFDYYRQFVNTGEF